MKAALITEFGTVPSYGEFDDPEPGEGEMVVSVAAAGLHQLVRGQASGKHYSSAGALPQVPGADGVARLPGGGHGWFGNVRKPFGTMAEKAPTGDGGWIALPEGGDPIKVAGLLNPASSSWLALRCRTELQAGQSVLVLGATGASGQLAVQVSSQLGAGRVIAAGRNRAVLDELTNQGADQVIALSDSGAPEGDLDFGDIDIVLDYLWGVPMITTLTALLSKRPEPTRPITLVQIGSMAGLDADLSANLLRGHNLRLVGSGLGSTPMSEMRAQLPLVIAEIAAGRLDGPVRAVPLSEVAQAWTAPTEHGERVVLVP